MFLKTSCALVALFLSFASAPVLASPSDSLQKLQQNCTNDSGQLFWDAHNGEKCQALFKEACPQGQVVSSSEDGLECVAPTITCLADQVVLSDSKGQRCVSPLGACPAGQALKALPSGKDAIVYECGPAESRRVPVRKTGY